MEQNYFVKEDEGQFLIIEKQTNTLIKVYDSQREASRQCRSLNLGDGFDGFTPLFMTLGEVSIEKGAN